MESPVLGGGLCSTEGPGNDVSRHPKHVAEMALEFWLVTDIQRGKKKFRKENIFGQKDGRRCLSLREPEALPFLQTALLLGG